MLLRHGSGKTAVLVERIVNKIINENVDIDKILVVTFTNAAAGEMRERILDSIYKKLDEDPDNVNLQKQIILLGKANISTIHSFCLDVIKNNFYEIDISPNFKIGDSTQIEMLKQEVLEELFEEKYINGEENFLKLLNMYTTYRGDDDLKELILTIYKYIQSTPFPEEWLTQKVEMFNLDNNIDFGNTVWGKILLKEFEEELENNLAILINLKNNLSKEMELEKYVKTILSDIEKLEEILEYIKRDNIENRWNRIFELSSNLKFEKWPVDKKATIELKNQAKEIRDKIKKDINKLTNSIFIYTSEEAIEDISSIYNVQKNIAKLVFEFSEKYSEKKGEKNIVDFNDIEHFALKILVKKDENGKYIVTDVAKKYHKKFIEIAIDEYQDSNLVQEYILNSISRNNNIFMVGDVKQSIYKFRQARPELFIEKYDTYKLKEEKTEKDSLKIQLFKNFRSRKNILDFSNLLFENIMSKELGSIDYNKDEFLNLGADFENIEGQNQTTELHIIENKKNEEELDDNDTDEYIEIIEKSELEAKFVSDRIEELIKNKFKICDKKTKQIRDITYKDIVILLRSTSNQAEIYEEALQKKNIPVFADTRRRIFGFN